MKKKLSTLLVIALFAIPAISESTALKQNTSPTDDLPPIIIPPYKITGIQSPMAGVQQQPQSFVWIDKGM